MQSFVQLHTRCNPIYYGSPRWSPDGSKIAFISSSIQSQTSYLDLIDVGSRAQIHLATLNNGIVGPSWSPDGLHLVVSNVSGPDIYVLDALVNSVQRQVVGGNKFSSNDPDWSPDGKRLAFTTWRYGYVTIGIANLTDEMIDVGNNHSASPTDIEDLTDENGPVQGTTPRWSPDGKRMAFIGNLANNPTIYVINVDGTGGSEVAAHGQLHRNISWSSDGKQIAYSVGGVGSRSVYTINVDGTNQKYLGYGAAPDWSPDGKRIAFIDYDTYSSSNYYTEIFVMNADGTNRVQVTQNPANGTCIH